MDLSRAILRPAFAFNALLTVAAVAFALGIQQMTPMMVRAGNHECFRERVSDEDRDAILRSAAAAVWVGILPLVVTSIAWIVLWSVTKVSRPVSSLGPTHGTESQSG